MYVKYYKHTNAHIRAFPKEANKSIDYNVDISILHPPPPPIGLAPMLSYPNELLFKTTTTATTKVQPNKLPQTTFIFRIIDGTKRFNNAKIQTHALGSICVRCDGN